MEGSRLRNHKDLDVWQRAMDLTSEIYAITGRFPKEELYGLTMQTRCSAVSITSNIAEGAARNSSKEFIQFLHVALGSAAELETQLLLAQRMGFFTESKPLARLDQIRKMLTALLRTLKRKPVTRHGTTFRRFDGLTVPSRAEGPTQGPTRTSSPVESLWVERSRTEPRRWASSPSDSTELARREPLGRTIAGQAQLSLRQRSGSTPSEVEGSRDALRVTAAS